ncbi:MAG: hypothetical protein AAGE03_11165 [Pseudomonadota bacterium]
MRLLFGTLLGCLLAVSARADDAGCEVPNELLHIFHHSCQIGPNQVITFQTSVGGMLHSSGSITVALCPVHMALVIVMEQGTLKKDAVTKSYDYDFSLRTDIPTIVETVRDAITAPDVVTLSQLSRRVRELGAKAHKLNIEQGMPAWGACEMVLSSLWAGPRRAGVQV